ncbi:MAG: hypothetical protein IBX72_13840 [Nitrospirae bacterium]|nr:hypothetical protein [Nitrospirota bacterium]
MAREGIRYYTNRSVRKRGKQDGRDWVWGPFCLSRKPKQSDPPNDQEEPTEFEKELLRGANENLSRISQKWSDIDKKLYKNCRDAEDKYKRAKSAVDRESGEHKVALENYETTKADFYKQPMTHMSKTLFWLLFVIITGAEFAFNALVFNVFGQSQIHTYLMAAGVIVGIPVFSDFIGRKLRMENKSKTTLGMMIGVALITVIGLAVIAILREKFFEAYKIVDALGIRWSANNIVFTFFIVNICLFGAIVVIAYEAGNKNPSEYKRAKRELEEAERKLEEEAGDLKEAAEELANARIEFNKAHSERIHEFEKIKYKAEEERDIWIGLVQLYRSSNMAARKEKTKPLSFYRDLEGLILIPESLQKLDCNSCCYEEERR